MTLADLKATVLLLMLFGFLALMAWSGKLSGIDGTKVRLFAWIVEDIGVANFGRAGATGLFVGLGMVSVATMVWVRHQWL